VAINSIQTHVDGKAVNIAPGSPFTPDKSMDVERLVKRGAIREVTDADAKVAVADGTVAADNDAPGGYAAGTSTIADEPGLDGTENDPLKAKEGGDTAAGPESSVGSNDSAEVSDRAPRSRGGNR
jgi:hypothetical protein